MLTTLHVTASRLSQPLPVMTRAHESRQSGLGALYTYWEHLEVVLCEFEERVCTGYGELIRTNSAAYRNQLIALLSDAKRWGQYVGGYCIHVGEDNYWLSFDDTISDEERGHHLSAPRVEIMILAKCLFPSRVLHLPLPSISPFFVCYCLSFNAPNFLLNFSFSPNFFSRTYLIKGPKILFVELCWLVQGLRLSAARLNFGQVDYFHAWYRTWGTWFWRSSGWLGVGQVAWHICARCDTVPMFCQSAVITCSTSCRLKFELLFAK